MLKWKRDKEPSKYHAEEGGQIIAIVVKTGTHLDDYPWDWYFSEYAQNKLGIKKITGVSDTLKNAKQYIEDVYD